MLVVVLIFLGIYNFAFKKNAPATPQTPPEMTANTTKTTAAPIVQEKIKVISDSAVLGAFFDKKTEEVRYYDATTGLVWNMDANGAGKKQISDTKVAGLKNVSWSPDHNKVLTTTQKDGKDSFYMYDYQTQKGTLLKDGLDTVVWDNSGTKIFYKYFDAASGKRTLNIANPDGSGWQKVIDIESRMLNVAPVPLTSLVSYWNHPNAAEETKLQVIGVTGGEPKAILSGKFGADYLWSPDGSMALVSSLSSKDSKTVMLGTVSIDGKYQELNIPSIVSKSVWSQDSKTLYYALPGGIPLGAMMPNDYQEGKFNTEDTFWKMDIATGEKKRIIETTEFSGKYDSSKLFLSATEDALYFVNKSDQKLYMIQL